MHDASAIQPLGSRELIVLALRSLCRYARLSGHILFSPDRDIGVRRRLVLLVATPCFLLLQTVNWLCLWMDDMLFRAYRHQTIPHPVFILGMPRSGTTLLHRTLAAEANLFSSATLWELLFAPSIVQKRVAQACLRLVHALPAAVRSWGKRCLAFSCRPMDHIHKLALNDAEEDFLFLLPAAACFALVAVYPEAEAIWRLARFDEDIPLRERTQCIRFYRSCLQRHLYVFGRGRRLLSKNVSFTPWIKTLLLSFPDAHFVLCSRPLCETLPSQLSSLRPALEAFGNSVHAPSFKHQVLAMLQDYERRLIQMRDYVLSENVTSVEMHDLQNDLADCVIKLLHKIELPVSEATVRRLRYAGSKARKYRSKHTYSLSEFGWNSADIQAQQRTGGCVLQFQRS